MYLIQKILEGPQLTATIVTVIAKVSWTILAWARRISLNEGKADIMVRFVRFALNSGRLQAYPGSSVPDPRRTSRCHFSDAALQQFPYGRSCAPFYLRAWQMTIDVNSPFAVWSGRTDIGTASPDVILPVWESRASTVSMLFDPRRVYWTRAGRAIRSSGS